MRRISVAVLFFGLLLINFMVTAAGGDRLRPFILAESGAGSVSDKVASVSAALSSKGFTIVGEYAPYSGAHLIIITNDGLRKQAAQSDFGGYGSALRVSITEVNGQVQVSYTNPEWMVNMYRMSGDMSGLAGQLKDALGMQKDFGSEGGRTTSNLREYHYMMFMPYFDDHIKLADYDSHQAALDAVESGLAAGNGGTSKIYSVSVDGKDEVLFGVALKEGITADQAVMTIIDGTELRHTAHLPYEMLVSGNSVYMLHGKFRIAQSFPDLTMTTFMKIGDVPGAIETALKAAAGGK